MRLDVLLVCWRLPSLTGLVTMVDIAVLDPGSCRDTKRARLGSTMAKWGVMMCIGVKAGGAIYTSIILGEHL